jgi:hypothetical protein
MSLAQDALDQFLLTYERNAANVHPEAVAAQFADSFIAAGPEGSAIISGKLFAQKLPQRKELFQRAGHRSSRLVSRRDIPIGDRYVVVDTRWEMDFAPDGQPGTSLNVGSVFLIDMGGPEPKILAYLTHQDIFRLMQERGLLPQTHG